LRREGREDDAHKLVRLARTQLASQKGVAPQSAAIGWAITHALDGERDAAIESLSYAHRNRWWTGSLILDHPYNLVAFDSLRSDRRFIALVKDYDRWIARERNEAARESREAGLPPPPNTPPPPYAIPTNVPVTNFKA
jgi:hypothetical protein